MGQWRNVDAGIVGEARPGVSPFSDLSLQALLGEGRSGDDERVARPGRRRYACGMVQHAVPPGITISTHDEPPPADADIVDHGLGEANAAAAPLHEVRPLGCFARDAAGAVIGGALGPADDRPQQAAQHQDEHDQSRHAVPGGRRDRRRLGPQPPHRHSAEGEHARHRD